MRRRKDMGHGSTGSFEEENNNNENVRIMLEFCIESNEWLKILFINTKSTLNT